MGKILCSDPKKYKISRQIDSSAILVIFQIIICKNMANKTPVQKVHMNYPNSGQAHEKSFTQMIELNTFTLL